MGNVPEKGESRNFRSNRKIKMDNNNNNFNKLYTIQKKPSLNESLLFNRDFKNCSIRKKIEQKNDIFKSGIKKEKPINPRISEGINYDNNLAKQVDISFDENKPGNEDNENINEKEIQNLKNNLLNNKVNSEEKNKDDYYSESGAFISAGPSKIGNESDNYNLNNNFINDYDKKEYLKNPSIVTRDELTKNNIKNLPNDYDKKEYLNNPSIMTRDELTKNNIKTFQIIVIKKNV